MKNLHPPGPKERLAKRGSYSAQGCHSEWTVHSAPPGRHVVRVAQDDGVLWHMSLDPDGRPERIQCRLQLDGRPSDMVLTFFDDECLIWRRGFGQASESVALSPDYRVLWPPHPGRDLVLRAALGARDRIVGPWLLMHPDADDGGIDMDEVMLEVRRTSDGIAVHLRGDEQGSDWPARMTLNEDGWLVAWQAPAPADDGAD